MLASYDDTLRYGAQTPFSDQLSFQWEGGMWEYDAQHDSIMTAGNGGTKPIQAAFTIFYNQGTERYDLEQTLQPDEQMWMDVGKLIREHVPDKNGKTLPPNLTSGSYEFRDLTDNAIGNLFEGKVIYDKTYGHAAYGCALCCALNNPFFNNNPFLIPYGETEQNYITAVRSCDGAWVDVTGRFNNGWSTANTNIATVTGTGLYTGVSVGTTNTSAVGYLTGMLAPPTCPAKQKTATGSDTVLGPFTVRYNAYIAVDHITSATTCTWAGIPNSQIPYIYIGDANRGTYRTAEEVQVTPDLHGTNYFFQDTGQSRNYGFGSPANGSTLSSLDEDNIPNDCYLWNNAAHISQPFSYDLSYPAAHQEKVHFTGSAYNPLESSAATITWDMSTLLNATNPLAPTASVTYNHTCYPAHQVKVNGTIIYSYIPPSDSPQQLFNCLVLHSPMLTGTTQPMQVPNH